MNERHYIYWPNSQKVSIERNIIFASKNEPKYAPIIPGDQNHPTYTHLKPAEG
jgi:hypothetical protein